MHRDLTATFQYLKGAWVGTGWGLFIRNCDDRTRSNMHKLKEGKYRSDIRKKFFTARVVRHWNTLPRQAVDAPVLAVFKGRLGKTLSSLV